MVFFRFMDFFKDSMTLRVHSKFCTWNCPMGFPRRWTRKTHKIVQVRRWAQRTSRRICPERRETAWCMRYNLGTQSRTLKPGLRRVPSYSKMNWQTCCLEVCVYILYLARVFYHSTSNTAASAGRTFCKKSANSSVSRRISTSPPMYPGKTPSSACATWVALR